MALQPPSTPRSKAGPTTALTSPADVQVVTSTISDDHTLSAKASNRPMQLDQTFPLKPAVRQHSGPNSEGNKHLSPTGSSSAGSKGRSKQKRVAFAEDQGEPADASLTEQQTAPAGTLADNADFDEVFEEPLSRHDDLEDATFELEEDLVKDLPDETHKEDEYHPPTLEEAARMLNEEHIPENASSVQPISSSFRGSFRDPQGASVLSSSIRMAGSFSQFMQQQGEVRDQVQVHGQRLKELLEPEPKENDPAVPPSPPDASQSRGRPIFEGASQGAEPLSTSQFGSYTAWNLKSIAEDNMSRAEPSRPAGSHFRRPSAGGEIGLNHIIGANAPSHRAMWQASRKSTKYALSEEDNQRWADWQRRGPAVFQNVLRGGLHAQADEGTPDSSASAGLNIPSRQPSAQGRNNEVDREAKTSLPYNEKLYVPSYMKAIGNMSTSRLGRGLNRQLSTITDEEGSQPSTPSAPVQVGFGASATKQRPGSIGATSRRVGPASSGAASAPTSSTVASSSSSSRVPFLAPQESERRRKLLQRPYEAPPGPTSSGDRLVETEEDAPQSLPLFQVPAQPSQAGILPGSGTAAPGADDFADADTQAEGVLKFMHRIGKLKSNKRTGWFHHRVEKPESIADHMYRMGVLAMLCAADDSGLDVGKCVMLALVHDMAEAEVGDLTPRDKVDKEEKTRREADAMEYLTFDLLGGSRAGQRIESLWQEYEARSSPEARLVKDLDRFELCLQALEYEREHNIRDLQPFFRGAIGQISHPVVRKWAVQLAGERQKMWEERGRPYEQEVKDVRPEAPPPPSSSSSSGNGTASTASKLDSDLSAEGSVAASRRATSSRSST
ncbi:hypothetical protein OC834_004980 [Tilletia horrida]|nr:hypothetical protein OC834_004980 [Tilletia horrida]